MAFTSSLHFFTSVLHQHRRAEYQFTWRSQNITTWRQFFVSLAIYLLLAAYLISYDHRCALPRINLLLEIYWFHAQNDCVILKTTNSSNFVHLMYFIWKFLNLVHVDIKLFGNFFVNLIEMSKKLRNFNLSTISDLELKKKRKRRKKSVEKECMQMTCLKIHIIYGVLFPIIDSNKDHKLNWKKHTKMHTQKHESRRIQKNKHSQKTATPNVSNTGLNVSFSCFPFYRSSNE